MNGKHYKKHLEDQNEERAAKEAKK